MASERYSFSLTTFSPSGKLVQIEYALAAVAAGAPSVGIKASNGVVIATENKHKSILYDEHSVHKIEMITKHIGMVYSGMGPDYRLLVKQARKMAQQYFLVYQEPIPTVQLVQRVAAVMQEYTQSGGVRPFGVSLLICGWDNNRPYLFQCDPSGAYFAWKATAMGKNYVNGKTFLEKRKMDTCQESKTKISEILKDFDMDNIFPRYLLELLAYTGFDSHRSLSLYDKQDTEKLESFAKNILPQLLNENEKIQFFGLFARNISVFFIVEGHKKLLEILAIKCREHIQKLDKQKLQLSTRASTSSDEPPKKRPRKILDTTSDNLDNTADQKNALEHIKKIAKQYQTTFLERVSNEEKLSTLPLLNNIQVEIKQNCAYVQCVKCQFQSKAYLKVDNGKQKWVLSNINRHFKTHFKIGKQENTPSKNSTIRNYFQLAGTNLNKENTEETENLEIYNNSEGAYDNQYLGINEILSEKSPLLESEPASELTATAELETDFCLGRIAIEETSAKTEVKTFAKVCNSANKTPSRRLRTISSKFLTFDQNQTKVTEYFKICDKIKWEISNTEIIKTQFNAAVQIARENCENILLTETEETSFFQMLQAASKKNTKMSESQSESSQGNRYPQKLKKLCLYLFLTSGRLVYETLYKNLLNGIPSITTVRRCLATFDKYTEGDVLFKELRDFLLKRNYPLQIFVSEDQTAIIRRIRYNANTNQIVGPLLIISQKTGFPLMRQNLVHSLEDLRNIVENSSSVSNAYVFMAQPLVDGSPAFCLCLFGSDNCFCYEDVLSRWKYLMQESKKFGITIQGFSSDGDTRCLKAMKVLSQLKGELPPNEKDNEIQDTEANLNYTANPYSPYFQVKFDLEQPIAIQDTIHIATKLKTRLLNTNIHLQMGKYSVSKKHLEAVIENYPKDQHFLCSSFLDGKDKMNFEAIDKLSSPAVTFLLMNNDEHKATRQLLIITRFILDSYLDKSLTVEKRVYLIWYVTFFLRLWRGWMKHEIKKQKRKQKQTKNISSKNSDEVYTLAKNWLTVNSYTCIELNAHGLLLLIEKCRFNPKLIVPWLCSSQPCEKFFRQTRSMTSTYSTVVNFDLLDIIQRRDRIQAINNIISDAGQEFIFPREQNSRLGERSSVDYERVYELPSSEKLNETLIAAKSAALIDSEMLGINLSSEIEQHVLTQVTIPKLEDQDWDIDDTDEENEDIELNAPLENLIHEEELNDIESELNVFSDFSSLNIKDYTGKQTSNDTSVLRVVVNKQIKTVKKSTLCWLFSKNKGRLSSDRLLRCKSLAPTRTTHKIRHIISDSESSLEENSEENYASESEFENESFSDNDQSIIVENVNINEAVEMEIHPEKYYAVYYKNWYIGRVIEALNENEFKIKFLKLNLDSYIWPKDQDIQTVERKFIFSGPINLTGNVPFFLKRHEKLKIVEDYKRVKETLKNFL